jgi:hypothetical protein
MIMKVSLMERRDFEPALQLASKSQNMLGVHR